jgi:hypothetical protein
LAGHEIDTLLLPPGQKKPALQMGHGLVPVMDPFPAYPGKHRHEFWLKLRAAEYELVGHVFCTLALHQLPAGHARHWPPLR